MHRGLLNTLLGIYFPLFCHKLYWGNMGPSLHKSPNSSHFIKFHFLMSFSSAIYAGVFSYFI